MSKFKTKLILDDEQDTNGFFLLHESLVYVSTLLNKVIVVPRGFNTDLASIPIGVRNIISPIGRYDKAAVVHDWLYRVNGVTRKQADDVLLEAMKVSNVKGWQQKVIYWGVRIGGWVSWNKYRKLDKKE